ncbi:hypothetical protein LR48_Vigan01g100400 [Vigna angularis]|uniref:Uncharacterized protein n=1 Tax=Phaseolus angularis TaxID=3914 RepID=A0A0L9TMT8_PHAAN|nr:hypothetical protein LR48_Vigan01g100400 [Vigna angularis]
MLSILFTFISIVVLFISFTPLCDFVPTFRPTQSRSLLVQPSFSYFPNSGIQSVRFKGRLVVFASEITSTLRWLVRVIEATRKEDKSPVLEPIGSNNKGVGDRSVLVTDRTVLESRPIGVKACSAIQFSRARPKSFIVRLSKYSCRSGTGDRCRLQQTIQLISVRSRLSRIMRVKSSSDLSVMHLFSDRAVQHSSDRSALAFDTPFGHTFHRPFGQTFDRPFG